MELLLSLVVPILRVAFSPWRAWQRHRRGKLLSELAARSGWEFSVRDPELAQRWPIVHRQPDQQLQRLTPRWSRLNAHNVVSGRHADFRFVAFEASWFSHEDNEITRRVVRQVVGIELPGVGPTLWLSGRRWDDVGRRLLVESEQFNKSWQARALDERQGHAVLSPQVIARLNSIPAKRREIRFEGATLVSIADGYLTTKSLVELLREATELAALVPGFLWRDKS